MGLSLRATALLPPLERLALLQDFAEFPPSHVLLRDIARSLRLIAGVILGGDPDEPAPAPEPADEAAALAAHDAEALSAIREGAGRSPE